MAYPYYLVSHTLSSKEVISTNVYAVDEGDARARGAVILADYYSVSVPASAVVVKEESGITSDTVTTT